MRVNCGTVGISNGMKKYLELKVRQDKKGKGMLQYHLACVELDQAPKNGFAMPVHLPKERWHGDDVIISLLGSGA